MPGEFRILVASDGSPSAREALDAALGFPWPEQTRVCGAVALGTSGLSRATRAALARSLYGGVGPLREALRTRFPEAEVAALHDAPAQALLAEARRFRADVIALGWRGHGTFRRLLAGSVSRRVVADAKCSVLVVRTARKGARRFVVGFDGSENSRRAIRLLERLPAPRGNRVFLLTAIEPLTVPPLSRLPSGTRNAIRRELARKEAEREARARKRLDIAARVLRRRGWHANVQLRSAAPLDALLELARTRRADALVVGARGIRALDRALLGSVAAGALDRSPIPVLIAR